MDRPTLLWVDLTTSERTAHPCADFERYCRIRFAENDLDRTGGPAERADAICFDYDYPDMSSLKLIPETKQRYPSVPLLMVTTQHSEELAVWAFRARVFDYLIKPLCPHEISRCMTRLTEALKARRAQTSRRAEAAHGQAPTETRYRPVSSGQTKLQPAVAHILRHFGRRLPEPEMAALCGLSPYRFSREFRAAFGMTFQEYLLRQRMTEARRLLMNPNISVTDVAMMVGFNDPSYFARVFKREIGASPSEYRDSELGSADPQAREEHAQGLRLPLPTG